MKKNIIVPRTSIMQVAGKPQSTQGIPSNYYNQPGWQDASQGIFYIHSLSIWKRSYSFGMSTFYGAWIIFHRGHPLMTLRVSPLCSTLSSNFYTLSSSYFPNFLTSHLENGDVIYRWEPPKSHLISKCLFGVFNFFQKTNENNSTWGIIVLKLNFLVRFLEELMIP